MALNQLGLGFVFTAKDLASGVIGRVGNAFGGMEEKSEKATQSFIDSQTRLRNVGLAIAGAGVAIIGTAAALAAQAAQFEDAIARAGARAGLSAEQMERFHDAAFDVSATVRGFSVVWGEIQKLGAALGFTSQRAGGVSSTMSTLGEVAQVVGGIIGSVAAAIAGVIATAMRIAGRAIAVVIGIFRALVGVVEGIVDIFAGIVTGDWARVWVGFKKVVLNALNFLAQILLGFVETVAGIIDAVASIFGADLGWADAIHGLREDIEKGLTGGVEEVTAGVEVRPRGPGEVLARATARAERGAAARSFVPVPVPG